MGERRFGLSQFIILIIILSGLIILGAFLYKSFFTPKQPSLPQLAKIPCPVPEEFCKKAILLSYKDQEIGWGFKLPEGTPIKTVFEGTLEDGAQSGGELKKSHPIRWLHGFNEYEDFTATYNFFAVPVSSYGEDKMVRVFSGKETIATASAEAFPDDETFKGVNFIFSVTRGDKFNPPLTVSFE